MEILRIALVATLIVTTFATIKRAEYQVKMIDSTIDARNVTAATDSLKRAFELGTDLNSKCKFYAHDFQTAIGGTIKWLCFADYSGSYYDRNSKIIALDIKEQGFFQRTYRFLLIGTQPVT